MEIELLTYDGAHAGFCDRIVSASFAPKFCGTGNAEYHLAANSPAAKKILTEPFLFLRSGEFLSVVIGHTVRDTLGEELAVYGRTLSFFAEKTLVPPVSFSQKTAGEMVSAVLPKLCGVPFSLDPESADFARKQDVESEEYQPLSRFLETVLSPEGGGYEVIFSGGALSLRLLLSRDTGKDISVSDGNASSVTRTYDLLDRACAGYRKGEDGAFSLEGTPDETPLKNWYTVLADGALSECVPNDILTADLRRLSFGKDYALGDIFTVRFENEAHLVGYKRKIVGVTVDEDKNGYRETPEFAEI